MNLNTSIIILLYYIMEKLKVFIYGDDHGGFGDFIKSLKMYINYSLKNIFI